MSLDQFQIFFKYRGTNKIQSEDYQTILQYENTTYTGPNNTTYAANVVAQAVSQSLTENSSINIFIAHDMQQSNTTNPGESLPLPGYQYSYDDAAADIHIKYIFVTLEYAKFVLQHEMGHVFGLKHTNEDGASWPETNAPCEHVERPEPITGADSGNVNCNSTGDRICDTYASPIPYEDSDVDENGNYIGAGIDCINELQYTTYDDPANGIYHVPIKNFMNVNREEDIHFQSSFTAGQGAAMRYTFESLYPAIYARFEAPLESLYEPFEAVGGPGVNIISVSDTSDPALALVCRNYIIHNRFQEGFDYVFPIYDEFGNVAGPTTTAGINDIPDINNKTFDFPVIINQVSPQIAGTAKVVCTKEIVCDEEPYISGHLYSMQVLGSMNITVEELNKIEVTDPQLYDKLMSQYYYILKKMTESGAIKEDMFYKP